MLNLIKIQGFASLFELTIVHACVVDLFVRSSLNNDLNEAFIVIHNLKCYFIIANIWQIQQIFLTFRMARSIIFLLCCLKKLSAPDGSLNSMMADLLAGLREMSLTWPQLALMRLNLSALTLIGRFWINTFSIGAP